MVRGLASYHVHDMSDIWKSRLPTQEKGLEREVGLEFLLLGNTGGSVVIRVSPT